MKWDYTTRTFNVEQSENILSELGAERWEAFCILPGSNIGVGDDLMVFAKRPVHGMDAAIREGKKEEARWMKERGIEETEA